MRKKRKPRTRKDLSYKPKGVAKKKIKASKAAAPKTRNNKKWSEAEYFQRVRSALRRAFRFWEPMQIALKNASRPSQSLNKRLKTEYQCNKCKEWHKRTDVQIDHKEECGSLMQYSDIVPFLQRLTVEEIDAYQILCKPCHKLKTTAYLNNRKSK